MFAAFLSPDMTYSCAIWRPKSDPKSSVESLEQAQQTKLKHIIDSAHIKSTDHILEIGTGWGSFAILAVNTTGCRVTSLTLSAEQKELAEQRIAEAGLAENIEVLLCDYRACPTPKDTLYDKIISIEMLEHVGKEYLKTYFECVDRLLKPNGGIAVFQCSTMPNTVSSLSFIFLIFILQTTCPLAIRKLQPDYRLHQKIYLPRLPSAYRLFLVFVYSRRLTGPPHTLRLYKHWCTLLSHAPRVAKGVPSKFWRANQTGAPCRAWWYDR